MKFKIKSLICIVLSIITCFGLVSCNEPTSKVDNQTETKETHQEPYYSEDMDYSLKKVDGKNYLIFDDPALYPVYNQQFGSVPVPSVTFSTMKEFKDGVARGFLTEDQKKTVAQFDRDDTNNILVCDFENLYEPALPNSVDLDYVSWKGETYTCIFKFSESNVRGYLDYLKDDQYDALYQSEYVNFFDGSNITVTKTENLDNGKVATYYKTSTSELKRVRYVLNQGDKTIMVDKHFLIETQATGMFVPPVSSVIPYRVDLYCTDEAQKFLITLSNLTEDPTDEWLLEFGLEKYVDDGTAVK